MNAPQAGIWKVRAVIKSPELAPPPASLSRPREIKAPQIALVYSSPVTPLPIIDPAKPLEWLLFHWFPQILRRTFGRARLREANTRSFFGDQVPTNTTSHSYLFLSSSFRTIGLCSSGSYPGGRKLLRCTPSSLFISARP